MAQFPSIHLSPRFPIRTGPLRAGSGPKVGNRPKLTIALPKQLR